MTKNELLGFAIAAIMLVLWIGLTGCMNFQTCKHLQRQCNAGNVHLCNSRGQWEEEFRCEELGATCDDGVDGISCYE